MEKRLTSVELSKKLYDAGCRLETENILQETIKDKEGEEWTIHTDKQIFRYDLVWDVCVKYAKDVFGKNLICCDCGIEEINKCECQLSGRGAIPIESHIYHSKEIMNFLQQNKKQDAEEYIIKHSLFFKEEK